jgi:thioesterase domain-containing protein
MSLGGQAGMPVPELFPLRPGGERPPLFLVHPSGGSTVPYISLVRLLDAGQPALGIDAAGLDGGPPAEADAMIDCYLGQILAAQPEGPYHLAGWSVGGAFAFGIAAALRARGAAVGLLALLDSFDWEPRGGEPDPVRLLLQFAETLAGSMGAPPPDLDPRRLRELPPGERFTMVFAALVESGVANSGVAGFIRQRLATFSAIVAALNRWHAPRYDGRIDLVCAADGPGAGQAPFWSSVTTGPVVVHATPGDHYTMMQPPTVSMTARVLQDLLDRVAADGRLDAGR